MFRRVSYNDTYGNGFGNSYGAQQAGMSNHRASQAQWGQQCGVTRSTARMAHTLRQAQLAQENRVAQMQQAQQPQQTQQAQQAQQIQQAQYHKSEQFGNKNINTNDIAYKQPQNNNSAAKNYFDPSVQFEAVTEDMLKMLGRPISAEQAKQIENPTTPPVRQPETKPEISTPKEIPKELFANPYLAKTNISAEKIAELVQDEYNGASFYRRLTTLLDACHTKNLLEQIITENDKRVKLLGDIYTDITGRRFEPKVLSFEFDGDIKTGLKAALTEENAVIEKIIDILETEQNAKLQLMLLRKLNNVNKMLEISI